MSTERSTSAARTASDSGASKGVHPSPHRERVGAWAMWFGILGAPVAWSVQQLINAPLFAHGCYPKDVPLAAPIWGNAGSVGLVVEVVAVVLCVAAGLVALRNWRRTREEKEGSGHHLMESGDGRSRFMAMVGIICSGLFLLAVVVATAFLVLVQPCNG
jgi:hypothetical protein